MWELTGQSLLLASLRAWALTISESARVRPIRLDVRTREKFHPHIQKAIQYATYSGVVEVLHPWQGRTCVEKVRFKFMIVCSPLNMINICWAYDPAAFEEFELTHEKTKVRGTIRTIRAVDPDHDLSWRIESIKDETSKLREEMKRNFDLVQESMPT